MNYFDYAATTPIDPEILQVYNKVSEEFWGNTSSLHDIGGKANQLLENCREKLAALLDISGKGIYFTSGGTEGNHLALATSGLSRQEKGKHIIISGAEHSSIHSTAGFLEKMGFSITKIPIYHTRFSGPYYLKEALTNETTVVSIAHINGEIGSIQPLKQVKIFLRGKHPAS